MTTSVTKITIGRSEATPLQLDSSNRTALEDGDGEKGNSGHATGEQEKGKHLEMDMPVKQEQDTSRVPPQPIAIHPDQQMPRRPDPIRQASNDASRWLAFTIPTRYRKRFDEYMLQRQREEEERQAREAQEEALDIHSSDSEASNGDDGYGQTAHGRSPGVPSAHAEGYFAKRYHRKSTKAGQHRQGNPLGDEEAGFVTGSKHPRRPAKPTSRRMSRTRSHASSTASHNESIPGWAANELVPGGAGNFSARIVALQNAGVDLGLGTSTVQSKAKQKGSRLQRFQRWLIRSAFAPLFLRIFNLAFTSCTLAVAIVRCTSECCQQY